MYLVKVETILNPSLFLTVQNIYIIPSCLSWVKLYRIPSLISSTYHSSSYCIPFLSCCDESSAFHFKIFVFLTIFIFKQQNPIHFVPEQVQFCSRNPGEAVNLLFYEKLFIKSTNNLNTKGKKVWMEERAQQSPTVTLNTKKNYHLVRNVKTVLKFVYATQS